MKKEGSRAPHAVRVLCIKIGAAILCTALIAAALLYTYKQYEKYKFTALSALISSELMYCAELTTVKAVYSDVVTLKRRQVLGLAKSYSIVRYSGVIRAGIADMGGLTFTLGSDRTSITVRLPRVQIIGNDISSMEIFDEYKNIFAPISSQEVFTEILAAKEKAEQSFIARGLLQDAELQSLLVVRRVLSAMGFKHIAVGFAE